MGRRVAVTICTLLLTACTVGGGDLEAGPAGFDIAEVRRRVEGDGVRCTDPDRDPTTVAPLPQPAAMVSCDSPGALLVIAEYRSARDVVKLDQAACDIGMAGYQHLAAGRWRVEIEDDYGTDVDAAELFGPIAERLGVEIVELDCP
jgi:hypothetical protein